MLAAIAVLAVVTGSSVSALSAETMAQVEGLTALGAPNLAKLLARSKTDPKSVYDDIRRSPLSTVVPVMEAATSHPPVFDNALPVVVGHGMGDSCFNPGMKQITTEIGTRVGAYAKCIPTGDNEISDTINGFLLSVDKSIDVFAEKIRNDTNFKDGFNVFSLSQSGLIVRGYIERYNNPPVKTWLAGWPVAMGVAAIPHCAPSGALLGPLCTELTEALGDIAYEKLIQDVLFQAGMFRDPTKVNTTNYLANSVLADLNNVGAVKHPEYATNFNKVEKYVMIRGMKDTMIWPNQGEWWALPNEDPSIWNKEGAIENMTETSVYKSNSFGLATADAAGKIVFESSPGDHMQFTMPELYGWVDKYFK